MDLEELRRRTLESRRRTKVMRDDIPGVGCRIRFIHPSRWRLGEKNHYDSESMEQENKNEEATDQLQARNADEGREGERDHRSKHQTKRDLGQTEGRRRCATGEILHARAHRTPSRTSAHNPSILTAGNAGLCESGGVRAPRFSPNASLVPGSTRRIQHDTAGRRSGLIGDVAGEVVDHVDRITSTQPHHINLASISFFPLPSNFLGSLPAVIVMNY
ncbi:hypothetical protein B0H14DRAFT_2600578 [Mycena olivaceomarginata]|nr:hypothetical protein B0H14DRAFT_2600578 [Mycena olivaceomarginata]